MAQPPLLEIKDLGKRFPARAGREPPPWVIQGLSFAVRPGEFLTIIGPSGAGKSTLLNMIAQIDTVTAGEIVFDGQAVNSHDPRTLRPGVDRRIGYVTSGAYGHHVQRSLALAFVETSWCQTRESLSVTVLGRPRTARILPAPPYDPHGTLLRG